MNAKSFIVLASLFVGQLLLSCNPCDCSGIGPIEITYTGVGITPYSSIPITLDDLVIQINVEILKEQFAMSSCANGFATASACDCAFSYVTNDGIVSMQILAEDFLNQESADVSNHFEMIYYGGLDQIPYDNLVLQSPDEFNYFRLNLTEKEGIPSAVVFIVNLELESGKVLSARTEEIVFND